MKLEITRKIRGNGEETEEIDREVEELGRDNQRESVGERNLKINIPKSQ